MIHSSACAWMAALALLLATPAQANQLGSGVSLQRDAASVPLKNGDDDGDDDVGDDHGKGDMNGRQERRMRKLVNQARAQGRQCGEVFYPPAPPISWDSDLDDAAERHSEDMAEHNFFSHTGSDGSDVGQRASTAGYEWLAIGENIAMGQRSVNQVMQSWLDSPEHCANIMNPAFVHMGAAAEIENHDSDGNIYWTQVFGAPLP